MELVTIILRTLVIYVVILIIFRLMGKREIGQLSIVDFVISLMIAELAVITIENVRVPVIHQLIPMFLLMLIQITLAYISLKSRKLRKMIDGKPSVIIRQGKIDEREMRRQRYNFDDLMLQLRQKDIQYMSDVEFALLEPSGQLSVIRKDPDESVKGRPAFIPFPLVLDGEIQEEHLSEIGRDVHWLRRELRKKGVVEVRSISFCSLNRDESLFVDLKNE
ncbi:DUF421 domain-containing protein [Salipaludibacillus sp. LMS25]|jgi:uncharacterized membrane protein YcaP (DUF421 family)|uniref:DUF421 domain-containing protein n=1 Tax=Salipaludibacillus sp. LMS25 TaxID=2924031 RepID=UPI0020D1C54A|nr:DUF421 domain-containing protein [Salipaludibacillus sp. LMS25]UTR14249.1 DUF421 domain-containing protein [Salipaludibacillus sp. LMS25]